MEDEDARRARLERFCRDEYPRLVRLLHMQCGDRATAEDLAQEALSRTWKHWDEVDRLESPPAWVTRVAINLATSWWRRRRTAAKPYPRPPSPGTGAVVESSIDALALLRTLPPRQRAVIVLRFHEDRSVAETAVLLGCAEGTVTALTAHAIERLRSFNVTLGDADA
jgi:RNA polymerase sigma-70 factor (sigma-E family)